MPDSEEIIVVQVSFLGTTTTGVGTRTFVAPSGDGRAQGEATWAAATAATRDALKDAAPEFVRYLNEKQASGE